MSGAPVSLCHQPTNQAHHQLTNVWSLRVPSSHLDVYTLSSIVNNNPFNMVTLRTTCSWWLLALRKLKSYQWVKSNAFKRISWRYNLTCQWLLSYPLPFYPNDSPYCWLYISLPSLKTISSPTISMLSHCTPIMVGFIPHLLLLEWPCQGWRQRLIPSIICRSLPCGPPSSVWFLNPMKTSSLHIYIYI